MNTKLEHYDATIIESIDSIFKEKLGNQNSLIEEKLVDMKHQIGKDRKDALEEMNNYIKDYFQEWLDINALN